MTTVAERHAVTGRPRSLGERAITALLTNPVAMAVKRPVRNLLWSIKGLRLMNPPLPAKVESILFVCLGNICRSPFAALLAERNLAAAGGAAVRCVSAGIRTKQAARPPLEACAVAADYGLSLDGHRPTTLTRELVDGHHLVVVMEALQLQELRATYPHAAGRLVLLSLFDAEAAGYERYNIADPFAQPREAFEASYRRIDRAVSGLLGSLT